MELKSLFFIASIDFLIKSLNIGIKSSNVDKEISICLIKIFLNGFWGSFEFI